MMVSGTGSRTPQRDYKVGAALLACIRLEKRVTGSRDITILVADYDSERARALRSMKVMALTRRGAGVLEPQERPWPPVGDGQVLVRVHACGVCRTDLHVVDDELPRVRVPIVPGHEIVGRVEQAGAQVADLKPGDRVGIPWLAHVCGRCQYCRSGHENLCPEARFTGYDIDGGYAEQVVADASYVFKLPEHYSDVEAAPLLCAGLIGYRSYRMAGDAGCLGLYGFGAAAHIIAQVAVADGREVFAFTSPGDERAQAFARSLGVAWAGGSNGPPPAPLDAAIIFAPVGALVPEALLRVRPGGTVVCAGIHMSDIPTFPYARLWGERAVRSVANLTRRDGREFLEVAARLRIRTETTPYPLAQANRALGDLRGRRIEGAAVIVP
jgi:propanol-preferring alcohol dehydrogenase